MTNPATINTMKLNLPQVIFMVFFFA